MATRNPRPPRDNSAARLAAIVQSSDDAIISKDLRGVVMSWNPAAEKMFGYREGEAIGRPIADLIIPPDRQDEERDILARIARGESVEHLETERVTKDGQRVHISLTVSPIRDAAGEVIGASKVARDVGERRGSEESRARLAAIVDSSEDAIISKTLDGVIGSWNPAAERLFGYAAKEAIGRHITLIVPPERHTEEEVVLARIRAGEKVDHFETVRRAKDGRLIDVSLTVSPVRNAAGEIIGASKISRDITERRRAEAEHVDLLAREQAAREEAEALNRSKDQFLAVLSHELRTPLNAIFGWARMLHDAQIDPGMRTRGTEVILRNAKAQLQLVEDLLDVSRIITGNMRLEVRPVDLRPIVEAAVDSVRPAAEAKNLRLDVVLGSDATVVGAADRLQQVVWNLAMNAVKFTPKGGRVQITLHRVNSHTEIVVSDTGEGISPELLPYVFDRFRQGDSTSTRAHGGLGIGLSLVRHLVDLHGGSVRAESAGVGRGATFTVKLPISLAHAERSIVRVGAETGPGPAAMLKGVRVLLVDDDQDGLELAKVVLGTAGAEVRTSTSGSEATAVLAVAPMDVLVLDIEMPLEDGYALLRRIRAGEAPGQRTPAIALTAYASGEDRKRAFAAGFNLHLGKPVDPAELTVAIATLAGRHTV
jgi:PAS domain S-box-containing protein